MYVVLGYLVCILLALLCTALVFAVWTALILAKEGAKVLGDVMRNVITARGQMMHRNFNAAEPRYRPR